MRTVYVDNNATTRVAPEVFEAMVPYFSELYGNPSSMHFFGGQVERKMNEAREEVADFLGAEPSEIVWYEVYEDDAALAAHGGSDHMKAFGQRLPDIVDVTQIKVERLERLDGFVRESFAQST